MVSAEGVCAVSAAHSKIQIKKMSVFHCSKTFYYSLGDFPWGKAQGLTVTDLLPF